MAFEWKSIVSTVAPIIGGTLGGPMAASAMRVVAAKLTGDENATEAEVEKAVLAATPAQLSGLQKADQEFKVEMAKLGFKEKELHAKDRHSAREMAKKNMWPQIILSSCYTVGYFLILTFLLLGEIKLSTSTGTLVTTLMGIMTSAQVQIMNFWFGSSAGSKDKDPAGKQTA